MEGTLLVVYISIQYNLSITDTPHNTGCCQACLRNIANALKYATA